MGRIHAALIDAAAPASPAGEVWERLVRANDAGGVMQSLHWAAARRAQGQHVLHLGLFEDGELMGGALCYGPARAGGASILIAHEGPIVPWADEERARVGLRALLAAIERLAPERGILALRVEPRLQAPHPPLLRSFGRAPVDLLPLETLYLDLARTEEEILRSMHPKARYNIGLAARRGVRVQEDYRPQAVQRFHAVLDEAARRDAFFLEPLSYFISLAEILCPAGLARFLFAEHAGDTLAAMLLVTYGERATYLYGGTTGLKRNLMAGYALQWAAMRAGRLQGCTVYDMYGYAPHGAPDHLYAGFSRFKRQFGGRSIRFCGAHDYYFLDHLADVIVRAVQETGGVR